jgi:hypothetical protein
MLLMTNEADSANMESRAKPESRGKAASPTSGFTVAVLKPPSALEFRLSAVVKAFYCHVRRRATHPTRNRVSE